MQCSMALEARILEFGASRFSSQLSKEERAAAKHELRDIVLKTDIDECGALLSQAVESASAKVGVCTW
jgi:hypothetical protein